jgi:glycine oxidase
MRVTVAGAGIIGLSIAWRLAQAGFRVLVKDAGRLAGESSWAGAGMLTPAGEFRDESRWTRLAIESLAEYGAYVAELTAATGVAIDFRVAGTLELACTAEEAAELNRARPAGIRVEAVTLEEARARAPIGAAGIAAAKWIPNEAAVDPRHVCAALTATCRALGVEFEENAPLRRIDGPAVIAAGAWANTVEGLGAAPRAFAVKGHLLGYHCAPGSLGPIVRRGHYYALQRANGFTIFGSDEQRDVWTRDVEPAYVEHLAKAAAAMLPGLLARRPDEAWCGLRPWSEAVEPVVEQLPGREVWLAYGHYRNGILLAATTGRMIAESVSASLGRG